MAEYRSDWDYNEPCNATFTETVYYTSGEINYINTHILTNNDIEADCKIGDNVYARCRRYGIRYKKIQTKQGSEPTINIFDNFSNCVDILNIYGSGDTYDIRDIGNIPFKPPEGSQLNNVEIGFSSAIWSNTIDTIEITDGITSIGYSLFDELSSNARKFKKYMSHTEPNSNGSFNVSYGMDNYENIDVNLNIILGSSVRKIGAYAFRFITSSKSKSKITNITIKSKVVEEIGRLAFANQSEIKGLDFGFNPTIVNGGAFDGCNNLEYVNISDNWTGNDYSGPSYSTFRNCYKLHTINHKNVIHTVRGTMYENCNSLDRITIYSDEDVDLGTLTKALYVELNAGTVLDEEGYFITEINKDSKIPEKLASYDWKAAWNRVLVYRTFHSVHLFHNGKHIEISCYNRGDIPLKHEDIWYFLRWIKLNEKESNTNQTPLHVAHNGQWYQITY